MKTIYSALAVCSLVIGTRVAYSQTFNWAKNSVASAKRGVTVDNSANSYVFSDSEIEKRNSAGTLQWTKSLYNFFPIDGVSDNSGNLYLTGYYYSDRTDSDVALNGPGYSVIVGTGVAQVPWTQVPNTNLIGHKMIMVKVNTSGNLVWAKTFSTATDYSMGRSLATDQSNNVYLLATGSSSMTFGTAGTLTGANPMFLLKVDASGNEVFVRNVSSSYNTLTPERFSEIDVNTSGEIVIASEFSGTRVFNPNGTTTSLTSAGSTDIFIARYSSAGAFQWAKRIGGTGSEDQGVILIDEAGNSYCGGIFSGTADFDPGAGISNLVSAGGTDMFIMSLNNSGAYRFGERIGSTASEGLFGMAQTDFDLIVSGSFTGTVDFNPTATTTSLTSVGGKDIFTISLSKSGVSAPSNTYRLGGTGDDVLLEVVRMKPINSLSYFQIGYFNGTVDFNPGAGTSNLVSSSSPYFVTRLELSSVSGLATNPTQAEMTQQLLGIENNEIEDAVIYPNPVENILNISSSADISAVTIYDVQGKLVYERTNLQGQSSFELNTLESGSYIAVIQFQNGEIAQRQLYKN